MVMKRAVGYCTSVGGGSQGDGCEDYAKGVFLLNHGDKFYCPRCRETGLVVAEKGISDQKDGIPFKEVRVEFNYCAVNNKFKEIAIVRDEAIWGSGSKYILFSPLIKTEKRALKVAEAILSNLQRYSELANSDDIPRTTEIIVSFDEDITAFSKQMEKLGHEWENSSLAGSRYSRSAVSNTKGLQ
jgi:hypothetical protein